MPLSIEQGDTADRRRVDVGRLYRQTSAFDWATYIDGNRTHLKLQRRLGVREVERKSRHPDKYDNSPHTSEHESQKTEGIHTEDSRDEAHRDGREKFACTVLYVPETSRCERDFWENFTNGTVQGDGRSRMLPR